jgi:hypothetical protein
VTLGAITDDEAERTVGLTLAPTPTLGAIGEAAQASTVAATVTFLTAVMVGAMTAEARETTEGVAVTLVEVNGANAAIMYPYCCEEVAVADIEKLPEAALVFSKSWESDCVAPTSVLFVPAFGIFQSVSSPSEPLAIFVTVPVTDVPVPWPEALSTRPAD